MEHCITELAPHVIESIFVKRVACILMLDSSPEQKIVEIIQEYMLMCGYGRKEDCHHD